jgi:hypothetical protein
VARDEGHAASLKPDPRQDPAGDHGASQRRGGCITTARRSRSRSTSSITPWSSARPTAVRGRAEDYPRNRSERANSSRRLRRESRAATDPPVIAAAGLGCRAGVWAGSVRRPRGRRSRRRQPSLGRCSRHLGQEARSMAAGWCLAGVQRVSPLSFGSEPGSRIPCVFSTRRLIRARPGVKSRGVV